jgi:hypothetical protein
MHAEIYVVHNEGVFFYTTHNKTQKTPKRKRSENRPPAEGKRKKIEGKLRSRRAK